MPVIDINDLPDDVESLRAMIIANELEHTKALHAAESRVKEQEQTIQLLEQQLAALRRARFGKQSEKLDEHIHQLELQIEDLQSSLAEPPLPSEPEQQKEAPARKPRQALPEHLPRDTIEHGKQEQCEQCGNALSLIGEDVSEQLEYVPASFRVIRHVRPKYSCTCCNTLIQAPAPSRPIPRSYAAPGLLAHVSLSLIHI